jgi:hypothetical protein
VHSPADKSQAHQDQRKKVFELKVSGDIFVGVGLWVG